MSTPLEAAREAVTGAEAVVWGERATNADAFEAAIAGLVRAVEARTREQIARDLETAASPPADFFQPRHTYTRRDGTTFRCDAITTHPTSGWLLALGWHTDTADWTFLAHQGVDQWNHDYDQNGEQR